MTFLCTGAPPIKELKDGLESSNVQKKIDALRKLILLHLNGEPLPQLLFTVIQFVLPNEDHTIKKLLLYYWEIVQMTDGNGKLLQIMILVP